MTNLLSHHTVPVDVWEEDRHDSNEGQECAYLENEFDACLVGKPAKEGRTDTAEAEIEPEKQTSHHADFIGLQLCRVDENRRKCR